MPRRKDPAMTHSNFERIDADRYFTEGWCTEALLRHLDLKKDIVWEPACGRGDIVKVLQAHKANVVASDIDLAEFDIFSCPCEQEDFLTSTPWVLGTHNVTAIVTNPPYDYAEEFVRHALSLDVEVVAMFLRSEFNQAGGRMDLFNQPPFAFEVALTSRPRWDWWLTEEQKRARRIAAGMDPDAKDASPRHNFSWFVWDRSYTAPSTQYFEGKKDK